MKRRSVNLSLFGDPYQRKGATKNSNRQVAALNRQRDENGKFLWGPRKSRVDRLVDKGCVFKITRTKPRPSREMLDARFASALGLEMSLPVAPKGDS